MFIHKPKKGGFNVKSHCTKKACGCLSAGGKKEMIFRLNAIIFSQVTF